MKVPDVETAATALRFNRAETRSDSGRILPENNQSKAPEAVEIKIPSRDRILFNKLEGANAAERRIARQIREVDSTLEAVEKNLEQMRASLESVLKIYPPYPQGSNERIQALRQFGGLRQLIDQLTVPPPDDSPARILGDEKIHAEAGDWEFTSSQGEISLIIGRQPIHSGSDGLDIADLAPDASDQELQDTLGNITKAQQILRERRGAFVADANRVIAAMS